MIPCGRTARALDGRLAHLHGGPAPVPAATPGIPVQQYLYCAYVLAPGMVRIISAVTRPEPACVPYTIIHVVDRHGLHQVMAASRTKMSRLSSIATVSFSILLGSAPRLRLPDFRYRFATNWYYRSLFVSIRRKYDTCTGQRMPPSLQLESQSTGRDIPSTDTFQNLS